jgi:lipoprotein-releasing system ATP-binding protein
MTANHDFLSSSTQQGKKYLLEAIQISKSFLYPERVDLFQNLNFSCGYQESIAITGPSGEGKTTLLHILGTLEKKDSGEIKIHSKSISSQDCFSLRNSTFGFVFQNGNLLEDFSALENVIMPARIARTKDLLFYKKRAVDLLLKVGLEKRVHFPIKVLSGGERQRVAIARAFCMDPDLILADEPSGNLDHHNSHLVHKLLIDFVKEEKKSLICVTHNQNLAFLCDKVFELNEGKLIVQK